MACTNQNLPLPRRLFPGVVITIKGLKPALTYRLSLRVTPADLCRYKFLNMHWSNVGESEINQNEQKQLYRHPSSPNTGAFWMRKPISFRSIKITHSPTSKNGNVRARDICMDSHQHNREEFTSNKVESFFG